MTIQQQSPRDGARTALDTLALLSGKWHPRVILTLLQEGPHGFNELRDTHPDISGKVLSETLDDLQAAEIVWRAEVSSAPLRVEYDLTSAGTDMGRIFDALEGEAHQSPRVETESRF